MATLTSAGAVNLTSSANWSPAQVPAAGDDLIIGAHTLTLDADLVLGSVTFNNAASRLAFTGPTRAVEATNGWYITGAIAAALVTTAIGAGVSLSLVGKWSFTNNGIDGFSIATLSGGNLSIKTVGENPAGILIENPSSGNPAITKLANVSAGLLTTTGRFNVSRATYGTIVAMTGGLWTHSSSGQNIIGGFQFSSGLTSLSGAASIVFTGDVIYTPGGLAAFSIANNWSGSVNFVGSFEIVQSGVPSLVSFGTGCTGSFTFVGSLSLPANNTAATIPSGTFLWQNQTATLPQAKELRFNLTGGVLSFTGLVLNNYGRFAIVRTTGSLLTDSNTQIRNHAPTGQALALNSDQFDGRILQLGIDAPTLPAPEDVAAETEYGYQGFELIGTGLIVDPAIISAAVVAAIESTAPSGPYRLTISALDGADLVPGVGLSIVGVSGTSRTTGTGGPVSIDLAAGEYLVRVSVPFGFAPVADVPVELPGPDDDLDLEIALTPLAVTPPAAGNVCRVTLRVADESDAPWVALPVFATLVSGPAISSTLHANRGEPVLTDSDGIATLDRIRGQVYDITARRPDGVEITIRRQLPNAANADLSTLTVPA